MNTIIAQAMNRRTPACSQRRVLWGLVLAILGFFMFATFTSAQLYLADWRHWRTAGNLRV